MISSYGNDNGVNLAINNIHSSIQECKTKNRSFENVSVVPFMQITPNVFMQKIKQNIDARKGYLKLVSTIVPPRFVEVAFVLMEKVISIDVLGR